MIFFFFKWEISRENVNTNKMQIYSLFEYKSLG